MSDRGVKKSAILRDCVKKEPHRARKTLMEADSCKIGREKRRKRIKTTWNWREYERNEGNSIGFPVKNFYFLIYLNKTVKFQSNFLIYIQKREKFPYGERGIFMELNWLIIEDLTKQENVKRKTFAKLNNLLTKWKISNLMIVRKKGFWGWKNFCGELRRDSIQLLFLLFLYLISLFFYYSL